MNAGFHPPQVDKQSQAASVAVSQWSYVPVYEVAMGFAFALSGLISIIALIAGFLSGSSPSFGDLALTIAVAVIGTSVAVLTVHSISQSWLRITVRNDIEIYRWLRRSTDQVARADAQAIQLSMYVSPIFGMRAEAVLILSENEQSIDLPVLRHLLPSKQFRRDALNLAQTLQVPLLIPDRGHIPLGFRSSFDSLRVDSANWVSELPDQAKLQHQAEIESLIEKILLSAVTWKATEDGEFPYRLDFDGEACEIRVNDWPEHETVYSLIVAKQLVRDLPSLPNSWKLPDSR